MDNFELGDFESQIRTPFLATDAGDEPVSLELVTVTPLERSGVGSRKEPFSLLFLGPLEPALPQRIYILHNDSLGDLGIFLVPLGPDEEREGMRYEAVFN